MAIIHTPCDPQQWVQPFLALLCSDHKISTFSSSSALLMILSYTITNYINRKCTYQEKCPMRRPHNWRIWKKTEKHESTHSYILDITSIFNILQCTNTKIHIIMISIEVSSNSSWSTVPREKKRFIKITSQWHICYHIYQTTIWSSSKNLLTKQTFTFGTCNY